MHVGILNLGQQSFFLNRKEESLYFLRIFQEVSYAAYPCCPSVIFSSMRYQNGPLSGILTRFLISLNHLFREEGGARAVITITDFP